VDEKRVREIIAEERVIDRRIYRSFIRMMVFLLVMQVFITVTAWYPQIKTLLLAK
jgi:hypothetical protein